MKIKAIQEFLKDKTPLSHLFTEEMEVQVNVAQDGGEKVSKDFKGRRWHEYTDGIQNWKSFRIPYNAASNPEYTDSELKFDLNDHAEGIGLTGWNWVKKQSEYFAFDFDSIIGHSGNVLTDHELNEVKEQAAAIPFVTIRKSTSGRGLHLYVTLENPEPTANHTEHAALARSILGKISALSGFDFEGKVDACGGIMWIWHRKLKGSDGLLLIKEGEKLSEVPADWRDHLDVVSNRRKKVLPKIIKDIPETNNFEELAGQRNKIKLDSDHKLLIDYLEENGLNWWWDQDHHMLITHTASLKKAHTALHLIGVFETVAQGTDPNDHNCFCFPNPNGGWSIRRYSPGIKEAKTWQQDGKHWTKCMFNVMPDLLTVAKINGGQEHPKKGFVFNEALLLQEALTQLGVIVEIPSILLRRTAEVKELKEGKLFIQIQAEPRDNSTETQGWGLDKKMWYKTVELNSREIAEPEHSNYDSLVRHLVTETGDDYGWLLFSDNQWRNEPLQHIILGLKSRGAGVDEINNITGTSVFKAWKLVNRPFLPEYIGNREWNRNAPQLRFAPQVKDNYKCPTWEKVLEHCGHGLDEAVLQNAWCIANGITKGSQYLKCWIASAIQNPLQPLPYLFFYGPQNSGKSIFHEAISLLVTCGYQRADAALISPSGFNGELENSVFCVVEETDLSKQKQAYNRIKDWVTSRQLLVHKKMKTPYHTPNTTHWIQCSNDISACPVNIGDTRIVMSYVDEISLVNLIPKKQMIDSLEKEAEDFISDIYFLEIPESNDRLNIPIVNSDAKISAIRSTQSSLSIFLQERCVKAENEMTFSDFYAAFINFIDDTEKNDWSLKRVSMELPSWITKYKGTNNVTMLKNVKVQ